MAEITFFNMWQPASHEDQEALISAMRTEAPRLAVKDGFISLAVWKSEKDDYRVLVKGRWLSQAHFDAAVADNAQALESRSRLEKFAKPAPGLFTEYFRLEGKPNDGSRLDPLKDDSLLRDDPLLKDAANRWKALGFETSRIPCRPHWYRKDEHPRRPRRDRPSTDPLARISTVGRNLAPGGFESGPGTNSCHSRFARYGPFRRERRWL
jgi:heme-degrading monooxygenase HmoA